MNVLKTDMRLHGSRFFSYMSAPIIWETKVRGLVPAAWPRALAIVTPYTGREINPEKYCSRLVMPVAEN